MWLLAAMLFVVGAAPAAHAGVGRHLLVAVVALACVDRMARAALAAALGHVGRSPWAPPAATFLTYQRIFGREAGVTLLVLMAALKLLEMRSQRDVVLSIYLGFFLVMTNFLFSQTIPMGLYMLACVWIFVATWWGSIAWGARPRLGERLGPRARCCCRRCR